MLFKLALLALPLVASAKRSQITFGDNSISFPKVSLPAFEWLTSQGVKPCPHATYSLAQLQAVAQSTFGEDAVWHCIGNTLSAVFWSDETTTKSTCPSSGIKWLPDLGALSSLDGSPAGQYIISVINSTTGVGTGCLGEGGLWSLGACAPFNLTSYDTIPVGIPRNFTLESPKGNCTAVKGAFACKATAVPDFFQTPLVGDFISFNGTDQFYSPFAPMGPFMKMPVLTAFKAGFVNISLEFAPVPAPPPMM